MCALRQLEFFLEENYFCILDKSPRLVFNKIELYKTMQKSLLTIILLNTLHNE